MSVQAFLSPVYQWFFEYCRNQKGMSDNTIKSYSYDLLTFHAFLEEKGLILQDVTFRVIDEYFNRQATGAGNKKSTLRRKIETLKTFFKYLYRIDEVEADVMKKVDAPRIPRTLPKYLSPEQQSALIQHFEIKGFIRSKDRYVNQRDKIITMLFLDTGLRLAELCNLKIRDVDFNRRILRVMGKGSKEAEVYLPDRSREALEDYIRNTRPHLRRRGTGKLDGKRFYLVRHVKAQSLPEYCGSFRNREDAENGRYENLGEDKGFLFVGNSGGKLDTRSLHAVYFKASKSLGFKVHPHLLRHTFASNLRMRGADLLLIKEALRHEHVSTTQIYAHLSSERYRVQIGKYLNQPEEVAQSRVVIPGPWAKKTTAVA